MSAHLVTHFKEVAQQKLEAWTNQSDVFWQSPHTIWHELCEELLHFMTPKEQLAACCVLLQPKSLVDCAATHCDRIEEKTVPNYPYWRDRRQKHTRAVADIIFEHAKSVPYHVDASDREKLWCCGKAKQEYTIMYWILPFRLFRKDLLAMKPKQMWETVKKLYKELYQCCTRIKIHHLLMLEEFPHLYDWLDWMVLEQSKRPSRHQTQCDWQIAILAHRQRIRQRILRVLSDFLPRDVIRHVLFRYLFWKSDYIDKPWTF